MASATSKPPSKPVQARFFAEIAWEYYIQFLRLCQTNFFKIFLNYFVLYLMYTNRKIYYYSYAFTAATIAGIICFFLDTTPVSQNPFSLLFT